MTGPTAEDRMRGALIVFLIGAVVAFAGLILVAAETNAMDSSGAMATE